jgi:hypothetical protein
LSVVRAQERGLALDLGQRRDDAGVVPELGQAAVRRRSQRRDDLAPQGILCLGMAGSLASVPRV